MSSPTPTPSTSSATRARGRSNRGGLGKYLRSRGRGRGGGGRPAEFRERLVLEGERRPAMTEEEEEEAAREVREKYARRRLGTNEDRYKEQEVELDEDGEPVVEPEVDLSSFLERQRISDDTAIPALLGAKREEVDAEDVDTSLAHISSHTSRLPPGAASKKGKVEQIVWDDELDEMSKDKKAAEATWDLKTRFRAKSERLRTTPVSPSTTSRSRKPEYQNAPALPLPEGVEPKPKSQMDEMEDFLDDLLT
ncbi:hypothetical protein B0H34DRAFT_783978 [Crassisporium funariophilum]|nr:hypothetical protein B0H34DRAFT_783978 [Crassisporium funariophilum]